MRLSVCCGARIKWGDICSACLEHTEPESEEQDAILVDPFMGTVEKIRVKRDIDEMCRLIDADTLDSLSIGDNNYIWLDDEGLYKHEDQVWPFWLWDQYPQPLAGKGLIMHEYEESTLSVEEVKAKIRRVNRREAAAIMNRVMDERNKLAEEVNAHTTQAFVVNVDVRINPEVEEKPKENHLERR